MPKKTDMPSEQKAHILLDAVEDRKAVEPTLLDVRGKTLVTDFILICAGTSNTHIRAISDSALEKSEDNLLNKPRVEGVSVGEWVLMDFGDVVLHIMDETARARYKLEQFWTTPQPKGALPPTPGNVLDAQVTPLDAPTFEGGGAGFAANASLADDDEDDDTGFDGDDVEEDDEDAAFFGDADEEVAPIDEPDDLDDGPGANGVVPGAAARNGR